MNTATAERPTKRAATSAIPEAVLANLKDRLPDWLQAETGQAPEIRGANFTSLCPLCTHHKPKLEGALKGDGWVATCRVCGEGGDLPKMAQRFYGCGFREACERASSALSLDLASSSPPVPRRREQREGESKADKRKRWPIFAESPEKGVHKVAALRGIPWQGVRAAHDWGILRFAFWKDEPCWILRDHRGTCAEARRLDGEKFWTDGPKAFALDGSEKKNALLGEDLLGFRRDPVFLTEGGPDFLAACWLSYAAMSFPGAPYWTPLGFLGATCDFTLDQLGKLAGRLVRVFVHHDDAGLKAAERWAEQLCEFGCTVELPHVGRLAQHKPDGRPVEDLNDALMAQSDLNKFAKEATALWI